ncbi:c-type cytochrome [Lacimicrobium alkaliphilum]|uniref:Mono-heme cytochrome C n=1 Tax=Lacimicrobium alkaliphilum TaxID=1526571 RepID=A0ABQ1RTS5_9ALTE|nr:c-type cytochrome [Lacimicrobium alkaliphilum]GGD79105.1 mono-heme cytochrome C [Lacimicrobium alkaliphilum]
MHFSTFNVAIGVALGLMAPPATAQVTPQQMQLLVNNCLQCHAAENTSAPLMGDKQAWQARLQKGRNQILRNTVEGINGMPPMGYCSACTEQDLNALIDLMLAPALEESND